MSTAVSVMSFVAVGGVGRIPALGMDWDEDGGDIDCPMWSIWFELVFDGENGDVIPLGFVADDERLRDNGFVPEGKEDTPAAARVAIDGVDGDATKLMVFIFN